MPIGKASKPVTILDEKENITFIGYLNPDKTKSRGKEIMNYNEEDEELVFSGTYLDNKRYQGKGKEYDSAFNLTFDGDYINGNMCNSTVSYGGMTLWYDDKCQKHETNHWLGKVRKTNFNKSKKSKYNSKRSKVNSMSKRSKVNSKRSLKKIKNKNKK